MPEFTHFADKDLSCWHGKFNETPQYINENNRLNVEFNQEPRDRLLSFQSKDPLKKKRLHCKAFE